MASLHPSQDSWNLLIGPHSASLRALSPESWLYVRGIPPLEIQQLQHPAPDSLHPPLNLSVYSLAPMRPIHERIFLATFACVPRREAPTREWQHKHSSLESLWLIPNQATASLNFVAEGSLQPDTSICVLKRKAYTREWLHKQLPPGNLSGSFLIGQLPFRRHPQLDNCHPYGSSPVGNYRSKNSFPLGNCLSSSPIAQLSSRRFILDWATASLSVFWGEKLPLENHTSNTYL